MFQRTLPIILIAFVAIPMASAQRGPQRGNGQGDRRGPDVQVPAETTETAQDVDADSEKQESPKARRGQRGQNGDRSQRGQRGQRGQRAQRGQRREGRSNSQGSPTGELLIELLDRDGDGKLDARELSSLGNKVGSRRGASQREVGRRGEQQAQRGEKQAQRGGRVMRRGSEGKGRRRRDRR